MNRSYCSIGTIFSEIQEAGSVSKKMIYRLIEEFADNPNNFLRGMEQCYLKICKKCNRAQKKHLEKFEKITEKFFQVFSQEAKNSTNKSKRVDEDDVYGVLQHLINFLCKGLEAPNTIVRQICAKHISIMLKVFSKDDFESILDEKVIANLNQGNVSLLKSKQPSLKLLGLKIASYIQNFESDEVQQEVVNIAVSEESRDVRKVAIVNLQINENTLSALLSRTRDVDSELRILVYKKLIKHKVHLINLKLDEIYKIVYDGIFAREEGVKEQCANYLREVYYMFESCEISHKSATTNTETTEESRQTYFSVKTCISRFLKIFQIQKSLVYPHIYNLIENVVIQSIKTIIPLSNLEIYVKEFIRIDLKQQKLLNTHPEEIFFVRVTCQYVVKHPTEFPSLNTLIDDLFPSLAELSKILDKFYGKRDLLSTYQVLLLAEFLLNSDETGRQALISSLRTILLDTKTKLTVVDEDKNQEEYNDVFPEKTDKTLILECYSQSFLDIPIIQNVDDLVQIIVRILRKLLDDKNNAFSTLLLESISEIREPVEKSKEVERNQLIQERKRLLKHVEYYDKTLKEIEDKLQDQKNYKRNKQQQQLAEILESEKENLEQQRRTYITKLKEIDNSTSSINIRCLNIACSLLEGCRLSLTDPGIMGLLGSFIGPCFQEPNSRVKDLSFKCLSLYLLLDKRTCADYMKVYKNLIDEHYERNESEPSLLTAMKACFDFFLIFKFGIDDEIAFDNDDDETFEAQDVLEGLIALMYSGDTITKKICVEGFCKLLFNNGMKNSIQLLSQLALLWISPNLNLDEGTELTQILSMFFKAYTPYSYGCLKNSEQAFEVLIELLYLVSESKDLEFSEKLSITELTEDLFTMILRTLLSLLKKDEYRFNSAEKEEEAEDKVSPLERLFVFLALFVNEKEKAGKFYKKVFAKIVNQFEFDTLAIFNKELLIRFANELAEEKDENLFKEYLKRLRLNDEDLFVVDEEELNKADKRLVEEIKKSRLEAKHLVKYLLAYKVLFRREKKKLQHSHITDNKTAFTSSGNKTAALDRLSQKSIEAEENRDNRDECDEDEGEKKETKHENKLLQKRRKTRIIKSAIKNGQEMMTEEAADPDDGYEEEENDYEEERKIEQQKKIRNIKSNNKKGENRENQSARKPSALKSHNKKKSYTKFNKIQKDDDENSEESHQKQRSLSEDRSFDENFEEDLEQEHLKKETPKNGSMRKNKNKKELETDNGKRFDLSKNSKNSSVKKTPTYKKQKISMTKEKHLSNNDKSSEIESAKSSKRKKSSDAKIAKKRKKASKSKKGDSSYEEESNSSYTDESSDRELKRSAKRVRKITPLRTQKK